MGTGTRENSRVIFSNLLKQTIIHLLPVFMSVLQPFQFVSMTQKLLKFG